MYRRAARHSKRAGARASPEHHAKPGKQEWAVIAFRCGSSNVGAETIYRRVWLFRDEHTALRKYDSLAPGYAYAGIVHAGDNAPTHDRGDSVIMREWMQQRRGINKDAEPWLSSAYAMRECSRNRSDLWEQSPIWKVEDR